MNPELIAIPEAINAYLAMWITMGAGIVGFLFGYLTKNYTIDKQIKQLENVLEERFQVTLDDVFEDLY